MTTAPAPSLQPVSLAKPWNDRAGRLSPLKLGVFLYLLVPIVWLLVQATNGWLGAKPLTEAIHQTGDWSVRFLMISLAVTPLRSIAQWPQLILVRRMLGLGALAYVVLHVALYTVMIWDLAKVVSEIVLRFYLTIGFIGLLGFAVLGATSTDGMIRRLGSARWNRLHASVYMLTVLALLHYLLQSKLDISEAALNSGVFIWLMGYRLLRKAKLSTGYVMLVALSIAAALLTGAGEALWYGTMTGVPGWRVLAANLDFSYVIRPAWWVLAMGLGMAALAWVRMRRQQPAVPLAPAQSRLQ
jgi:methionine sulfoxide reductase heme-binding subunit